LEHELAHLGGLHSCHTHDYMNLVPALLIWYSTLCNRRPLTPPSQRSIDYFGKAGKGDGLHIRHLLQRPVELALSARLRSLCFHCVLKQIGAESKLLRTPWPHILFMDMSWLFQGGYWNGAVLIAQLPPPLSSCLYCCRSLPVHMK
jgi:hypothetical protein